MGHQNRRRSKGSRREHEPNSSPGATKKLVAQLGNRVNGDIFVFVLAFKQPVRTVEADRTVNLLLRQSAKQVDAVGPRHTRIIQLKHPHDKVLKSLALFPPTLDGSRLYRFPQYLDLWPIQFANSLLVFLARGHRQRHPELLLELSTNGMWLILSLPPAVTNHVPPFHVHRAVSFPPCISFARSFSTLWIHLVSTRLWISSRQHLLAPVFRYQ